MAFFPASAKIGGARSLFFNSEEWEAFSRVLGNPPWAQEQRFSTLELRKNHEDELERLVSEWTQKHTAEEVMTILQAAGVAAGVVQNAQDVLERDPHLRERGLLATLEHPVLGAFGHQTPPFKLSGTPAMLRPAPCLGEHSEYVCTKLLGMADEEFVDLVSARVFE